MSINKKELKVETVDGVATITCDNEDQYYEGTDLTKAVIKEVYEHSSKYIEDATTVVSQKAQELMEKDKGINTVIATLPYGVSKRGSLGINVKRTHTYPGINGNSDVTKSVISVAVKDPLSKLAKSKVKALEANLTAALLS